VCIYTGDAGGDAAVGAAEDAAGIRGRGAWGIASSASGALVARRRPGASERDILAHGWVPGLLAGEGIASLQPLRLPRLLCPVLDGSAPTFSSPTVLLKCASDAHRTLQRELAEAADDEAEHQREYELLDQVRLWRLSGGQPRDGQGLRRRRFALVCGPTMQPCMAHSPLL
jgi:hypothetical protein